jgi:hypothetical protein
VARIDDTSQDPFHALLTDKEDEMKITDVISMLV